MPDVKSPDIPECSAITPSRRGTGSRRGTTSSELVLMLSVILVAVVGAATVLAPIFAEGVMDLSLDVKAMLSGDGLGNGQGGGGDPGGGGDDGGGSAPEFPDPNPGPFSSDDSGGDDSGGDSGEGGDSGGDSGDETGDDGEDPPDEEEEVTCPYVYDEASDRWRDPETGQYVSSAAAADAGC